MQTIQKKMPLSRQSKAKLITLMLLILAQDLAAKHVTKRGIMDNFNDGLKIAGQMFGINTAADVANLVAKAFSGTTTRRQPDLMSIIQQGLQPQKSSDNAAEQSEDYEQSEENAQEPPPYQAENEQTARPPVAKSPLDFSTPQILSNMLRMIGFDATKLGALAINALVMIAHAIGNSLMAATRRLNPVRQANKTQGSESEKDYNAATGPEAEYAPNEHEPRTLRPGTPIDWFLDEPNSRKKQLLHEITDPKLADHVVDMIESLETNDSQGGCLKLLMCKSSPFIWGMQKSLKKRLGNHTHTAAQLLDVDVDVDDEDDNDAITGNSFFNKAVLFKHLPSIEDFRAHGLVCETRFARLCNRNKVPSK